MFIDLHDQYEREITVDSSKILSFKAIQYGPFHKFATQITLLGDTTINVSESLELVKEKTEKAKKENK